MDYGYNQTEVMLQQMEYEVEEEYRQAVQEMQKKLDEYIASFRKKQQKKLQELIDGKITPEYYEYWYKGQVMIGQRWIEMRDTLAQDMTHANEISASIINGHLPDVYALNHNYSTFVVEKTSHVDTSYSLYSRETVERLLRERPLLYPQAVINRTKDIPYNQQVVTSAVLQGILQGEDMKQIKRRLMPEVRAKTNVEKFGEITAKELERKLEISALRSARTLVTSAQNSGRIDAYRRAENMGIKLTKVWLATPDKRVRDSHALLDGEEIEIDGEFSNGCEYPGDPNGAPEEVINCRCCLITQVNGYGAQRIDVEDLESRYSRLEGETYDEWKRSHER